MVINVWNTFLDYPMEPTRNTPLLFLQGTFRTVLNQEHFKIVSRKPGMQGGTPAIIQSKDGKQNKI